MRDEKQFWAKVDRHGADECWPWLGGKFWNGYGRVRWFGEALAHRAAFTISGGIFTEEQPFALHSCDNPPCCNPNHLRAGSRAENAQDKIKRGRHSRSARLKKLDAHRVYSMRQLLDRGWTQARVAKDFGVSPSTVSLIAANKLWKLSC